jgi:hypothetical protein
VLAAYALEYMGVASPRDIANMFLNGPSAVISDGFRYVSIHTISEPHLHYTLPVAPGDLLHAVRLCLFHHHLSWMQLRACVDKAAPWPHFSITFTRCALYTLDAVDHLVVTALDALAVVVAAASDPVRHLHKGLLLLHSLLYNMLYSIKYCNLAIGTIIAVGNIILFSTMYKTNLSKSINDNHQVISNILPLHLNTSFHDITGLRLAMIGDSVSRYQYVDLVHYLHTRRWAPHNQHPSIVIKPHFDTWLDYSNYTSLLLAPHEICNCRRPEGKVNLPLSYSNRYYHNKERGNYVTYISKWGRDWAKGHWDAKEIYKSGVYGLSDANYTEPGVYLWRYDWPDIIRFHLVKLDPPPRFVVINSGLWGAGNLTESMFEKIRHALDETGMIGIYKTTTRHDSDNRTGLIKQDKLGCRMLHACMDLSWTAQLSGKKDYWDNTHFTVKINHRFNQQLFQLVMGLEQEYTESVPQLVKT